MLCDAPPLAKISIRLPRTTLSREMVRNRELFSLIQLEGKGRERRERTGEKMEVRKDGGEGEGFARGDKSPPLATVGAASSAAIGLH